MNASHAMRDAYVGPATIIQHGSAIPVTCSVSVARAADAAEPEWSGQFRLRAAGNGLDLKGQAALNLPSGASASIVVVAMVEGRGIFIGDGLPPTAPD